MHGIVRRLVLAASTVALALGPAAGVARAATVANPDSYTMNEDGTLTVPAPGVLANDEGDAGAGICVVGYNYEDLSGTVTDWRTDGSFTFEPWSDWTGTTSFTYGMRVGDGQCIGAADDQSIVTVTVLPINEPPTAVIQGGTCDDGVTVMQDSGPFEDPAHCVETHNWGQSLDEVTQRVEEWVVTNDNPDLFSEEPRVEIYEITYGRLYFEPAPGASGKAEVTVRSRDDGGTARGGDDLSEPVRFTITVKAKATPPPAQPTEAPAVESSAGSSTDPLASGAPTASAAASGSPSDVPTAGPSADASAAVEPGAPAGAEGGSAMLLVALGLVVIVIVAARVFGPRLARRGREST